MLYFVFDQFNKKIDLTHLPIVFSEENDWFTNEFRSDMTFPVKIPKKWLQDITDFDYNFTALQKQFPGKLYRDGELVNATLKLQKVVGQFVECIFFFGLETFPGFDKKLPELNLEYIEDIEDMKEHALSVIVQNYPAVNYNFPMVHTDKYDPESEEFYLFQKIINNFSSGSFIENNLVAETNIDEIKNIMQPLPYLLHVMKKAVEDSGYTLTGDVLEINDLKKALLFRDGSYFTATSTEKIEFRYSVEEWDTLSYIKNTFQHVSYNKSILIEKKGDYLLFGDVICVYYVGSIGTPPDTLPAFFSDFSISIVKISSGVTTVLYSTGLTSDDHEDDIWYRYPRKTINSIDIPVSLEVGDSIQIFITDTIRNTAPPVLEDYPLVLDLDLFAVRYKNPDGSPIISLLDLTYIDLKKVVPECSVSELFMAVRLAKNLDFVVQGNQVVMNFIKPQFNRTTAVNLTRFEIEDPGVLINDDRTYEISFRDGKNDQYPMESIYIDRNGTYVTGYVAKKDTKPIQIDLLPLPIVDRSGINTALTFEDDDSKIRLVFFNALDTEELETEKPIAFYNHMMTIPAIYSNYYTEMINFFINSLSFEWDFIIPVEQFRNVNVKSLVYCYRNYHIFSTLERERLLIGTNQYWRISAKTESLPLTADPSS